MNDMPEFTPVDYEEDLETGESWPIYAPEDQAELDAWWAEEYERRHRDRMRKLQTASDEAIAYQNDTLDRLRQTIVEARANEHWHYAGVDRGRLQRDDMLTVDHVSLNTQVFAAQHRLSIFATMQMPEPTLHEMKDTVTHDLVHTLTAYVYGYEHPTLTTSGQRDVVVTVPASWWQHFKRDVLRSSKARTTDIVETVHWQVSQGRFTAFPALPFTPDPKWGPRINLALPHEDRVWNIRQEEDE